MSDLISRRALEEAVLAGTGYIGDVLAQIEHAPAIKPQVVANISGGILQGASSDYPVDIYALDFEVDGACEDSTGIVVDGDDAFIGQTSCVIDPDFVRGVIEAPEVYLLSGLPVEED